MKWSICRPGILWTYLCLPFFCAAQIKGVIKNEKNNAILQANVLLLNPGDSTIIKGAITDSSGSFAFNLPVNGQYLVSVSAIGFRQWYSPLFQTTARDTIDLGIISLEPEHLTLDEVTVVARKPLFEQKTDRMVVNIRNSITAAGSTVLEVLERSPGILIDRINNNITLNGKSGIRVMINGKFTNMPLAAVMQLLSGMSSSNIERVELIATPPASLDAEGTGYINIVFINNPYQGLNGSWTVTAGTGRGNALSSSINFNFRNKKFNLYGDYSINRMELLQVFSNYRRVKNGTTTTEVNSVSDRDAIQRNHNLRLGVDYELSKKTVAGMLIGGYDNRWSMDAVNNVSIVRNAVTDTILKMPNEEINHWKNFITNLNLQHNFSDSESITVDLNYRWYKDINPTDYHSHYYDGSGNKLSTEEIRSTKQTPIRMWIANADYKRKINTRLQLEAGLKQAILRFRNKVGVATLQQDEWEPDPELTADYSLKENISAAYAIINIGLNKKDNLKFGLRYEYTTTLLGSEVNTALVDRKYGRLFPSVFFNRKLTDNKSLNLSYSKRITRPGFDDLAPFVIFLDPTTFFSGNVNLRPAIMDAVKADYIYKNYVFSIGYSYEKDPIAAFQASVDIHTNKQLMQAQNLDYIKMLSLSATIPVTIAKWWNMNINITATGQYLKADYNKQLTKLRKADMYLSGTQSLNLRKNFSIELTGNYLSPSISGTYQSPAMGILNAGVQKKFKDNSSLLLNLEDVFSSGRFALKADRPEQFFFVHTKINIARRLLRITYTRSFGNKELKGKRERGTGAEEETGRVR